MPGRLLVAAAPRLGQVANLLFNLEDGRRLQDRDDLAEDIAEQVNCC